MPRPQTFDHLRGRKKPNTKKVLVVLDPDLADEFNAARQRLDRAKIRYESRPDTPEYITEHDQAKAEFDALRERIDDELVEFSFRSIGPKQFEELLLAHQPTPEQRAEAKRKGDDPPNWNPDTFPQALVAASLMSPKMTEAEVKELYNDPDWSGGETSQFFFAALDANSNRRTVDLGKG